MSTWFKKQLQETSEALKKTVIRSRNKTFLEAVVAAFVTVAHASGQIKPEERDKMLNFIRSSEVLSVFDEAEIQRQIDRFSQHFKFDPVAAERNAFAVIRKLRERLPEARLLVRVCVLIGGADGDFDPAEQAVVRKICAVLDLDAAEFNLPTAAPSVAARSEPKPSAPPARTPAPPPAPPPKPATSDKKLLQRGRRIALHDYDPELRELTVGLGWTAPGGATFELDAAAFLLDGNERVRSDADFIFYNQPRSACAAVQLRNAQAGDRAALWLDLGKVPETVQRIAFTVTIHEAEARRQRFGQVQQAFIRLVNAVTGVELARYDLSEDLANETALVFGELYRHRGDWRFAAVGQGYAGGLAALCQRFGVNL